MSFEMSFDKDDLRFLAHLNIVPPDETDLHAGCQTRWLEERSKRESAERWGTKLEGILTQEQQRHCEETDTLRHSLLRWRSFFLGQFIVVVSAFGYIEIGWPALAPVATAVPFLIIWRLLCRLRQHPRA